jgi:DNA-directed RNA polymerase subunit RPC12/RpoP
MIALTCLKCGTLIHVDEVRAGGTTRCPACGASVDVPARSSPSPSATELVWSDEVGPPPVRRREVPPPPVIEIIGADELAQAQARRASPSQHRVESKWEQLPAAKSQFTDAELGLTKPVSPVRQTIQREKRPVAQVQAPASNVSVASILVGCASSFVGLFVFIGAILMVAFEPLDSTPKLIVFLVILCTGLFLLLGGLALSVYKGMMGQ